MKKKKKKKNQVRQKQKSISYVCANPHSIHNLQVYGQGGFFDFSLLGSQDYISGLF